MVHYYFLNCSDEEYMYYLYAFKAVAKDLGAADFLWKTGEKWSQNKSVTVWFLACLSHFTQQLFLCIDITYIEKMAFDLWDCTWLNLSDPQTDNFYQHLGGMAASKSSTYSNIREGVGQERSVDNASHCITGQ